MSLSRLPMRLQSTQPFDRDAEKRGVSIVSESEARGPRRSDRSLTQWLVNAQEKRAFAFNIPL
jgi:hypothetical protein